MAEDLSDLTRLVRSLQRLDGMPDCFRSGRAACDGVGCVYRPYCLPPGEPVPEGTSTDTLAERDR